MNEAYIKAVCRLSRRGITDPTAQIAELQGEIDYYRNKVQELQEYIVNTNPQVKKSIDDLTRDALAAQACGMSYGRYKGLQHEAAERKGRPAPVIKQEPEPAHKEFNLVCVQCGVQFIGRHPRRKYCSDVCKNKHDQALYRERHPKNEKEAQSNGNI